MFTLLTIDYTFFESCVKADLVLNLCKVCVRQLKHLANKLL